MKYFKLIVYDPTTLSNSDELAAVTRIIREDVTDYFNHYMMAVNDIEVGNDTIYLSLDDDVMERVKLLGGTPVTHYATWNSDIERHFTKIIGISKINLTYAIKWYEWFRDGGGVPYWNVL